MSDIFRFGDELPEYEQIEKALCERSLLEFMRVFWNTVEGSPFKTGWHLQAICEHLEAVNRNQIRNLIINGPPRSSKSMPASVFFQPWDWISNPHRTWLTAGNTLRLATQFNYQSRTIMRSEKFIRYWGDVFHLSLDNDLKTEFSNNVGGRRLVVGINTRFIGAGGERKVVDDPHMPKDSPKMMQETGDWYFGTWRTRTNNPQTAAEILIMQRLSVYDLVEQIKVNEPGLWEMLVLPSRFNPTKRYFTCLNWTDPRSKEGQLLWPEHVDEESEKVVRNSLKERADAQMDQDPTSNEDALYKQENLDNFYDRLVYDRDTDIVISTTDTGVKSNATSDFSACAIILKKGHRKFHVAGFAKKLEIDDLINEYTDLLSKWVNRKVRFYNHIIEDSANGPALARFAGKKFNRIELIKAKTDKMVRLKAVVPEYKADKVWYPSPSAVIVIDGVEYSLAGEFPIEEWLKQTRRVPSSEKDDCPDATAQGLTFLEDLSFTDLGNDSDDDGDASGYFFFP